MERQRRTNLCASFLCAFMQWACYNDESKGGAADEPGCNQVCGDGNDVLKPCGEYFYGTGIVLVRAFKGCWYFTAPVMCFFLVEGFHYTHSRKKYGFRLALFAVLSELPFCLAFSHGTVLSYVGMNMIYTLFVCFLMLVAMERLEASWLRGPVLIGLALLTLDADWALVAPIFVLLFAWAGRDAAQRRTAFVLATLLFGLDGYLQGLGMYGQAASLARAVGQASGVALAGVVIVLLYNGKRQKSKAGAAGSRGRVFSKWFFYVFYPGHLLLLGLLRLALGL